MPDRPLETFQSRSFRLALQLLKFYRKVRATLLAFDF
jgi:hypothetical protein